MRKISVYTPVPKTVAQRKYLYSGHVPVLRSSGFQTCCVADFQVGPPALQPAGLETRDTADLEVCATLNTYQRNGQCGFTLTELLVVISIIVLLAALLVPAMASSGTQSAAARCMSNMRQLSMAWKMYADENGGLYPANEEGDQTAQDLGSVAVKPWVNGWETYEGGTLGSDTNTSFLVGASYTAMGPYAKYSELFKCPADPSRAFGAFGAPRVRSVSMNQAIGCGLDGGADGIGDWLDGGSGPGVWRIYQKDPDLSQPSPARLWLFVDEHLDSINDGSFAYEISSTSDAAALWVDHPAKFHENGCGFAFVDGHAVIHRWLNASVTGIRDVLFEDNYGQDVSTGAINTRDLRWVAEHTSARTDGGPYPFTQVPD